MTNLFYPRLAAQNIKNNGKFYFPYILTIIGTVAAFYIFYALADARDLPEMSRYQYLSVFMGIGLFVAGIFSVIFLFYTNSFLIKRRRKELGLYNVLGMDKGNIAVMLGFESLYIAFFGIGLGIGTGILLQKLVTMLVFKIMGMNGVFAFYVSVPGIIASLILFGAVILLTYLHDLRCIKLQKPVELLRGGNVGETEPKTKWLLTAVGVITLLSGYGIAVFTDNAIQAIAVYFLAVILVIIGTYCLFTAGSIAVLKLLRKNKKYYYKTSHFIGISGMLYRMKRNAVGLANIAILSCMVLVMISSTLSMYVGTEETLDKRCPQDINVELKFYPSNESFRRDAIKDRLLSFTSQSGYTPENKHDFFYFGASAGVEGDRFVITHNRAGYETYDVQLMCFMTLEDYISLTGDTRVTALGRNEVLTNGRNTLTVEFHSQEDNSIFRTDTLTAVGKTSKDLSISEYATHITTVNYIVVADEETLNSLWEAQDTAYGTDASQMRWALMFDIDTASAQEEEEFAQRLSDTEGIGYNSETDGSFTYYTVQSRAGQAIEIYSMNNGFFFLGIFLGLLFIMATVLIIYYKQVSEGYEDRERFQIMQKVGLPKEEIKRSVNRQILTIFFMPLIVAAVHVAFDFPIMTLLLTLFQLNNLLLTLVCTLITLAVFLVIYTAIYLLTSRVYYRIVE